LGYTSKGLVAGPQLNYDGRYQFGMSSDGTIQLGFGIAPHNLAFSKDSGRTWQNVSDTDEGITWSAVAVSPGGDFLVAGTTDKRLVVSSDRGATWAEQTDSSPCTSIRQVLAPGASGLLYIVGRSSFFNGLFVSDCIAKSADMGKTWTDLLNSGGDNSTFASVEDVTVSADGMHIAYVSQGASNLYQSADGGKTFRKTLDSLENSFFGSGKLFGRVASSSDGSRIVFASPTFLRITSDFGATWGTVGARPGFFDTNRPPSFIGRSLSTSADGLLMYVTREDGSLLFSDNGGRNWSARGGSSNPLHSAYISPDGGTLALAGEPNKHGLANHSVDASSDTSKQSLILETNSTMRYTDSSGGYRCKTGSKVTFYLGNLALGRVDCETTTHIYQLAALGDDAEKGLRIAQLLQSLNTGESTTRIRLPDLKALGIDVNLAGTDEQFAASANALFSKLADFSGKTFTLVDKTTAAAHISSELAKLSVEAKEKLCKVNACRNDLINLLNTNDFQRIGGTLTGMPAGEELALTLTLTDSTSTTETLKLGSNGSWKFIGNTRIGAGYEITLKNPAGAIGYECELGNASGVVPVGSIKDVAINCVVYEPMDMTLSGTVSGLAPDQSLTLASGDEAISINANGSFAFTTKLAFATAYEVTVLNQNPARLECSVENGAGSIPFSRDSNVINDIRVLCLPIPQFRISGVASGLPSGETITLSNIDSDLGSALISITTNGAYSFAELFTGNYQLSVLGAPSGLSCVLSTSAGNPDPLGVIADIACTGATLSGVISGLDESATLNMLLSTNAGDSALQVTGTSGTTSFVTRYLQPGTSYSLSITGTSAGISCDPIVNASGTMGNANISNVSITCSSSNGGGNDPVAGSLGGTVVGLVESDALQIENNVNFDFHSVTTPGAFTMPLGLAPGETYSIAAQYGGLDNASCEVTSGATGTMPPADATPNYVDDIVITCTY
tara:strand:+ start:16003 stop:18885 length:2883 start_codon:yes stop_codon:yes gene_type:complete